MNEIQELRTIWEQLDQVDGAYYNATENLAAMDSISPDILATLERVDISIVTNAKNEIEKALNVRGVAI